MSKYLRLKAEKHNWGLICADDWFEIHWSIYNDGEYEIQIIEGIGMEKAR